ncbi:MAG: HAD family hydrolase [Mycoplasmatales bacterium]|nr:HAD family hydrolase [Mycoplasmatales bacterium]
MKIKAFAFDMDGTLMDSKGYSPTKESIEALREAYDKGYKVILATGRPLCFALPAAEEIGCVSYIVSSNGSSIYDVEQKKIIEVSAIDKELYKAIVEKAKETNSYISVSTVTNEYREFYHPTDKEPKWLEDFRFEGIDAPIEWFDEIIEKEGVAQVSLKNTGGAIEAMAIELRKRFGEDNSIHVANSIYLDVDPKGVSKLTGIQTVIDKMGIAMSEVMAFGDSGNDLKMIQGAGYGVCMGNGSEEAKAIADEVIGHHDTDAIAKKIREVISNDSK